jgi:toxin ParE1/3/4
MTYGLTLRPAADADIAAAATAIAADSIEQALRFYDSIDATFGQLREHPERWALWPIEHPRLTGLPRCFVIGFRNHLIFYRVDTDTVDVIRVLHAARDPLTFFADETSPPQLVSDVPPASPRPPHPARTPACSSVPSS